MGLGDFWLQFNNGKKELLSDIKGDIRRETVAEKYRNIFDFFDTNKNGALEGKEADIFTEIISKIAGDKTLTSKEAKSIFSQLGIKNINNIDFLDFVKNLSDANKQIKQINESTLPDGSRKVVTDYVSGARLTAVYYPDGDLKYTIKEVFTDAKNSSAVELSAQKREELGLGENFDSSQNIVAMKRDVEFSPRAQIELKASLGEHFQEVADNILDMIKPYEKDMTVWDRAGIDMRQAFIDLSFTELFTAEGVKRLEELRKQAVENSKTGENLKDMAINQPGALDFHIDNDLGIRSHELEKMENFHQTTYKYKNAKSLKQRIELLNKGLKEVKQLYANAQALRRSGEFTDTLESGDSYDKNYAENLKNLKTHYEEKFMEVLTEFFNGDKGVAEAFFNTMKEGLNYGSKEEIEKGDILSVILERVKNATDKSLADVLQGENFENIESRYKAEFKEIYGKEDDTTEVENIIQTGQAIGGTIKIGAMTAITILVNALTMGTGNAALIAAMTNPLAQYLTTVGTDYALSILGALSSQSGLTEEKHEQIIEGTKETAKFIGVGMLSAPLCKYVGQTLAKYTGDLFGGGVTAATGAVRTTTVTGESLLQKICVKAANFTGSVGTEIGVFTLYGIASQDQDLAEAFGSNRDMIAQLKVINKFLEIALGRFVRAQGMKGQQKIAQTQYQQLLKETGLDNAKITKHETPTGTRFTAEIDGIKFTGESEADIQGKLFLIAALKSGVAKEELNKVAGTKEGGRTEVKPQENTERSNRQDLYATEGKTYIDGSSRGITIESADLSSVLKQMGFSDKGISDITNRFKNEQGSYNKEILEFINEVKKLGVDEAMAIHIIHSKIFRYSQEEQCMKCKIPTTGQMNDIIDGIAHLKIKGADDSAILCITDCIMKEDGSFNTNLLNKNSFEALYDFYNQFKDNIVAKHMRRDWLSTITNTFLIDNTGALNSTNIKFVKDILEKCPKNISILKYARDENGVFYSNTSEIIDYAASKSNELEPWQIGLNVKFLRDKNGRLNTKNEPALNKAFEKLTQLGIKRDKLEYLLDDNGILDFNSLDARINELIGIYETLGDLNNGRVLFQATTDHLYEHIQSNSRQEKLETLKTIAGWIKKYQFYPSILDIHTKKQASLLPEQIKVIDKILNEYGRNVFYVIRVCSKDCYKEFNNLLEKLKTSDISKSVQADIIKNSNQINIKIAERLCFDKNLDFPKEKIADFIRIIDETNIDFIKTILDNKEMYAKLLSGISQIGEKLSYSDMLSNLEFQYMKSKSGQGSKITDEALNRNVQKLNNERISKSELFNFLEENPNLSDKDVDAITDKIIQYHKYSRESLTKILENIEGSSSLQKLNILLEIMNIKEYKSYEGYPFFESISKSDKPITFEQLNLFKEIMTHYKNEQHPNLFINMLNVVIKNDNCNAINKFYTQLKTSSIDTENQLTMMGAITPDNVTIFSQLCFNNNFGFTAEEVIKVAQKVNSDNSQTANEIFEKCKEKQADKKIYISIVTGTSQEGWELLKHPFVKKLFLDNIEKEPSIHTSISSKNYVEIACNKKLFNIKIDNENIARIIGVEEGAHTKNTTGLKVTYENGSSKIERFWGVPGLIDPIGTMEIITDTQGRKVSRTITKRDKKNPNVLIVKKEIFDENGNVVEVKDIGSIKHYGSKDQGYNIDREFTSPGGTTIKHSMKGGPKGYASRFEVGDQVFERRFRVVDDNTTESKVWDNKYTAKFSADKVEVTVEKADGSVETVSLDNSLLDPQLMPLFKQLPVDYLYVLAKTGTKVYLDKDITKNAFFSPNRNAIGISKELANDPFTFAHELGHMLDHNVFENLNADKKLKEIFEKELEHYKMQSTRFNETEIAYFVAKDHVNAEGCLTEVIAEANAIISGLKHDTDFLLLRAKILQENFPETIAYIGSKIKEAMSKEIENKNTKATGAAEKGQAQENLPRIEKMNVQKTPTEKLDISFGTDVDTVIDICNDGSPEFQKMIESFAHYINNQKSHFGEIIDLEGILRDINGGLSSNPNVTKIYSAVSNLLNNYVSAKKIEHFVNELAQGKIDKKIIERIDEFNDILPIFVDHWDSFAHVNVNQFLMFPKLKPEYQDFCLEYPKFFRQYSQFEIILPDNDMRMIMDNYLDMNKNMTDELIGDIHRFKLYDDDMLGNDYPAIEKYLETQSLKEEHLVYRGEDFGFVDSIEIGDKSLGSLLRECKNQNDLDNLVKKLLTREPIEQTYLTSTSFDPNIAENFAENIKWELTLTKGTKAACIDMGSDILIDEAEVLIQKNFKLLISHIKQLPDGRYLIQATVLQ